MTKNNYVIDSWAWIEYFRGSGGAHQTLQQCLEEGNAHTPVIVLAELAAFYAREGYPWRDKDFEFIESKSSIAPLTPALAKNAGQTRQVMRREKPKFGLVDAIIFETAKSLRASVVTGDPHFEGLPNTLFLKTT